MLKQVKVNALIVEPGGAVMLRADTGELYNIFEDARIAVQGASTTLAGAVHWLGLIDSATATIQLGPNSYMHVTSIDFEPGD